MAKNSNSFILTYSVTKVGQVNTDTVIWQELFLLGQGQSLTQIC